MSIADVVPPFAKPELPSAEEYRKRKVALISGMSLQSDRALIHG